jgi:arsenite methyltransferase
MSDLTLPLHRRAESHSGVAKSPLSAEANSVTAQLLRAMAEPTRLGLLDLLAQQPGPLCVCDITPHFSCGQPTVSHHLKVLREVGLVDTARRGVWSYFWATTKGRLSLEMARRLGMTEDLPLGTADPEAVVRAVRERYAALAKSGAQECCGAGAGCCSTSPVTLNLYGKAETADLPASMLGASLGCGNPLALTPLSEGEVVLDLGSGAGLDVLLSARRVGATGMAIGVDMTDEMLALALRHRAQAGVPNAIFLKGRLEALPLPDASVDVVLSNCVINLVPDKRQALAEAFRVLRPGGRLAIADVVVEGQVPDGLRHSLEAWVGCLAGALSREAYVAMLSELGFQDLDLEITRRYRVRDTGIDQATLPHGWELADGKLASAFVRATKPGTQV